METVCLSFNIISPLLLLLAVGFALRRKNLLTDPAIHEINHLVFILFIPLNIFNNIYNSDFRTDFDFRFIVFFISMMFLAFILVTVLVLFLVRDNAKRGAIIQASFRGNLILFGLPLATSLYGEQVSGLASIVIAFAIPLVNILSVVSLETFSRSKVNISNTLVGIVKNPMIIASVAAMILAYFDIRLPIFISDFISLISKSTTTISLLLLGTCFHFHQPAASVRWIGLGVFTKLVLIPLLATSVAVALGYRNAQLVVVLSLFSAPTAVSCFPMAVRLNADRDITSGIVVYSYVFCMATILAFVYGMKLFGLI